MIGNELELIGYTAGLAGCAAMTVPYLKYVDIAVIANSEVKRKTKTKSETQRRSLIDISGDFFSLFLFGSLIGLLLSLYWLKNGSIPNVYERLLYAILFGFFTPQILTIARKKTITSLD